MSLTIQGCGKGKIIVQTGASLYSIEPKSEGIAFGSVVGVWWGCEVVDVGANVCYNFTKGLLLSDGTNSYYIIDESDYLYTETASAP